MIKKLFERIKYLENELEKIKKKNEIASKNIKALFKECKVDKQKKDYIKNELSKNLNAITNINYDKTFSEGMLNFSKFLEFVNEEKNTYLLTIKLTEDKLKNKFIYSFFTKNFNSLFSFKDNILIGVIEKNDIKKVKAINSIPFFNPATEEMCDIELFKVVFDVEEIDFESINKIFDKFKELSNRPSFKNKHFIEYSLKKDRIVDFEKEELQKNKEKYSYIYDEKYPDLEIKLKSNINEIPFVLTLLEKIDNELEEIKKSKGIENVVNRILNYIELNSQEEEIKKATKIIRDSLKS